MLYNWNFIKSIFAAFLVEVIVKIIEVMFLLYSFKFISIQFKNINWNSESEFSIALHFNQMFFVEQSLIKKLRFIRS